MTTMCTYFTIAEKKMDGFKHGVTFLKENKPIPIFMDFIFFLKIECDFFTTDLCWITTRLKKNVTRKKNSNSSLSI